MTRSSRRSSDLRFEKALRVCAFPYYYPSPNALILGDRKRFYRSCPVKAKAEDYPKQLVPWR